MQEGTTHLLRKDAHRTQSKADVFFVFAIADFVTEAICKIYCNSQQNYWQKVRQRVVVEIFLWSVAKKALASKFVFVIHRIPPL